MSVADLLDAGTELIDTRLGVLAARCPHCQGNLELLPADGRVDIGYIVGTADRRFDIAVSLPYDGLHVERQEHPARMILTNASRRWEFQE